MKVQASIALLATLFWFFIHITLGHKAASAIQSRALFEDIATTSAFVSLENPYIQAPPFFLHLPTGSQPGDAERDCSANLAHAAPKEQPPRKLSGQRIGIAFTHSEECPDVIVRRAYRRSKRAAPQGTCLVNLSGPEQRGRPLRISRTGSTFDVSGI